MAAEVGADPLLALVGEPPVSLVTDLPVLLSPVIKDQVN
jgi:hypothetical protein